jgi:hypothetical protein
MARTRIIIGHPAAIGSSPPFLIYLGASGSEAEAALKADRTAHHYEIFEGPGRRKGNAAYDSSVQPAAPIVSAPAPAPVEIPDDISGLKKPELVQAMVSAVARIKELEALVQSLRQPDQQQSQDLTMPGSADDQQPQDHTIPGSPDDLLQK